MTVISIPNVELSGELPIEAMRGFTKLSVLNLRDENKVNPNKYTLPANMTCVDLEYCMSRQTECSFNEPIHVCTYPGALATMSTGGIVALSLTSLAFAAVGLAVFFRKTERGRRLSVVIAERRRSIGTTISDGGQQFGRRMTLIAKIPSKQPADDRGNPIFHERHFPRKGAFEVITPTDPEFDPIVNEKHGYMSKVMLRREKSHGVTIYEGDD